MTPDKLIPGQPYQYDSQSGDRVECLYKRIVRLPNNEQAYNFRLRNGFVNLTSDQVENLIRPVSV